MFFFKNNKTFSCEQELALAEGALPQHLLTALYTQSADGRFLTNRQLSRHLVGLWTTDSPQTLQLLRRILPAGLLDFLDSEEEVPRDDIDRLNVRDNLKGLRHEIELKKWII
jgi:DnaJ family protein C protein 13